MWMRREFIHIFIHRSREAEEGIDKGLFKKRKISYPLYPQANVDYVDNLCTTKISGIMDLLRMLDEKTLLCYSNLAME